MSSHAPIAVFAFRRLDLLKQTLAALERCEGFSESPLYFFSDGARDGNPDEAKAVAELRAWLREWTSKHPATLHEAPGNIGLRPSIIAGVSGMLEQYDRVIVLEDDIIVSPYFLKFMNDGLNELEGREDIFEISGYFIPTDDTLPEVGLLNVPSCWGWATWRRAWRYYRDDAPALLSEVRARDVNAFDVRGSYPYLNALERNAEGTLNTWAVRWYASVFLQGGLTLYPGKSLTRNIGFGEGGTNCGPGTTAHRFLRQPIGRRPVTVDASTIGTTESVEFLDALEEFYKWQSYQWAKPTWGERLRARWNLMVGATPDG